MPKRLMVVATVVWIPLCVVAYGFFSAAKHGQIMGAAQSAGSNQFLISLENGGALFASQSEIAEVCRQAGWSAVKAVSVGYAVIMFMLFVFWFATSDSQKQA